MERIDNDEAVNLTDAETSCWERYCAGLDRGLTVQDAAFEAMAAMLPSNRSADFVEYLSDGTLRLTVDHRILRVGTPVRSRPPMGADEALRGQR